MNICRACTSSNINLVMQLAGVPRDVQHLISEQQMHQDTCNISDMSVYQCQDCGLVQAPLILNDDYYDDYLMTTSFSPRLQHYLDELVTIFLDQYARGTKKVLDVGCGDGAFMQPFRQRKIAVEGIEPSSRSIEAARLQGYKVYAGYMMPDTKLIGAPYDAFVSRQVLEHVHDISGFFQGIRRNLAPAAFGLIEVPRLEKALQDFRFYDFFPDHVNYFSLETLRTVLEINGFTVLGSGAMMDDEYNVVIVQLRGAQDFKYIHSHRDTLVQSLAKLMRNKKSQRIAMWGAGAKGLSIMAAMAHKKAKVDMVVDSDPNKLGRYTPFGKMLIRDPDCLVTERIGAVIISAIAYERAIIEKLQHMDFTGDIYLIRSQGLELYKDNQ